MSSNPADVEQVINHVEYPLMSSNPADAEQVIKGVGGLKHEDWRSFQNERVSESHPHLPKNCIDVKIEIYLAPFRANL